MNMERIFELLGGTTLGTVLGFFLRNKKLSSNINERTQELILQNLTEVNVTSSKLYEHLINELKEELGYIRNQYQRCQKESEELRKECSSLRMQILELRSKLDH